MNTTSSKNERQLIDAVSAASVAYSECLCDDHRDRLEIALQRFMHRNAYAQDFYGESIEYLTGLMVNPLAPEAVRLAVENQLSANPLVCMECAGFEVERHWDEIEPELRPFINLLREHVQSRIRGAK